jgi:hypothetical protein
MGLDAPVFAVVGEQACGGGAVRGVVSDAVDDLGRGLAGLLLDAASLDGEDLPTCGKSR